jgi:hypothetical protein
MSEDLLNLVNAELLPSLTGLGFRVVSNEAADVFDNAEVVLTAPALRIRVLRERSILVLDVGSISEPNTWFDSSVVMEYLGLSADARFHDQHARAVLQGVGIFITSMWHELTETFSPQVFTTAKNDLLALREERASRRFGG